MAFIKDLQDKRIRVVETQCVDAESLEKILNQMLDDGYDLSGMHFAIRETSRRPSMAFLIFHKASD